MNDATLSGLKILKRWLDGGYVLQLVGSDSMEMSKFEVVVQLALIAPDKLQFEVHNISPFLITVALPDGASVGVGSPDAESSHIAAHARQVKPPWVIISFPTGCLVALGELI